MATKKTARAAAPLPTAPAQDAERSAPMIAPVAPLPETEQTDVAVANVADAGSATTKKARKDYAAPVLWSDDMNHAAAAFIIANPGVSYKGVAAYLQGHPLFANVDKSRLTPLLISNHFRNLLAEPKPTESNPNPVPNPWSVLKPHLRVRGGGGGSRKNHAATVAKLLEQFPQLQPANSLNGVLAGSATAAK